MSPHYNRRSDFSGSAVAQREPKAGHDDPALEKAAEAIRAAEIEAVQPLVPQDSAGLESMSIDELRKLASDLDIPDLPQITKQDDLVAAIRQRL